MKRKFGLVFALFTLLLLTVVGLAYADKSIQVQDTIYITAPSSLYLSESGSKGSYYERVYTNSSNTLLLAIQERSTKLTNAAMSNAVQGSFSNYEFGYINNVFSVHYGDAYKDKIYSICLAFNTQKGNAIVMLFQANGNSTIRAMMSTLRSTATKKNGLNLDNDGAWRYYLNGTFTKFTGVLNFEGGKFFVANGVLLSDANGLAEFGGKWYFLAGGQVQTSYTGLALYDGWWFYITNGVLDTSKRGLIPYDGSKFLVADGQILRNVSGLWYDSFDTYEWYYLADGQVVTYYTGLAQYEGAWFYVKNGRLAREFTGYVQTVSGDVFRIVGGRVIAGAGLLNGVSEAEPTAEEVVYEEPDTETIVEETPPVEDLPEEPFAVIEPEVTEPAEDAASTDGELPDEPELEPVEEQPEAENSEAIVDDEPVTEAREPVAEEPAAESSEPVVDEQSMIQISEPVVEEESTTEEEPAAAEPIDTSILDDFLQVVEDTNE